VKASGLKWPGLSLEGAVIFQDMQREISQSDIVIAEITLANPNVFYAAANFRSILRAIGLSFTTTASVASRAPVSAYHLMSSPKAGLERVPPMRMGMTAPAPCLLKSGSTTLKSLDFTPVVICESRTSVATVP